MMDLSSFAAVRYNTNITMVAIHQSLMVESGAMYLHVTLRVTLCLLVLDTIRMQLQILIPIAIVDVQVPIAELFAMISTWTSMDILVLVCMEHHMYTRDAGLYERLIIHLGCLLSILTCGILFVPPSLLCHNQEQSVIHVYGKRYLLFLSCLSSAIRRMIRTSASLNFTPPTRKTTRLVTISFS